MPDVLSDILQTLRSQAAPALSEVVETMAFLCAMPLPEGMPVEMPSARRMCG